MAGAPPSKCGGRRRGVSALRSLNKRGAASVLEHAFEGDAFENLELVAGDATHGSKALVLRGTLEAINLGLQALCYQPDLNWNGVDVLRLTAVDGGDAAHGSGGVKTSEVRIALHVRGVRDSPVVAAPLMDVEALEDSIIQFGGEKTNEIYVASSFSDSRRRPRRPHEAACGGGSFHIRVSLDSISTQRHGPPLARG